MATTTVKTAISLPQVLFKAADQLAQQLHVSRSQLFATAISRFVKEDENRRLLAALNEAYAEPLDAEEKKRLLSYKNYHRQQIMKDPW